MVDFLRTFQHLLPRTRTWSLVVDRNLRRLFAGIADGLLTPVKAGIDSVWNKLDPSSTDELNEWENQLGIWETTGTDAARQEAIAAAWAERGGPSPRHLQDLLQAHDFDVYYHGWRESDGSVRDPRDYTTIPLVGRTQCRAAGATQSCCGPKNLTSTPKCDGDLVNDPGYIVNELLDRKPPPLIPDDEDAWRCIVYVCGETFGSAAVVEPARLFELKRLILKHFPGHLWIVLIQEPPS